MKSLFASWLRNLSQKNSIFVISLRFDNFVLMMSFIADGCVGYAEVAAEFLSCIAAAAD